MNILVAGAGGYIGVPLCQNLLSCGHTVTAVDIFYFGEDKIAHLRTANNIRIITADIRSVEASVFEGVDVVIDLAGLSNDAAADHHYSEAESINYRGCLRLAGISKAAGVRRFIYSSSASVYGAGENRLLSEASSTHPISLYAKLKLKTEAALLSQYSDSMGVVILRNPTLFGLSSRMRFDLALNVMTSTAIRKKQVTVHGDGGQWRPMVSVQDVVDAFTGVTNASANLVTGEIFNVGGRSSNIRIVELAELIRSLLPDIHIKFEPVKSDNRSYHLTFEKIYTRIGFKPIVSHSEGILSISQAIKTGEINPADPTCYTASWYESQVFQHQSGKNHP